MIAGRSENGGFGRLASRVLFAMAFAAVAVPAAAEVDSEHMFGFITGSDVGAPGEIEIEGETDSALGRHTGRYLASFPSLQLKYTVIENFRIAPHVELSRHTIHNQPDMFDINRLQLASGGMEFKWRALDRSKAPFGATFSMDTSFGRIDPGTGQRARDYGLDFTAAFDKELIHNLLFGAINLSYTPGWSRDPLTAQWQHAAVTGVGGALTVQIAPNIYAGGEVRYLRAYDSIDLSRFAGDAVYAGPTFFVAFTPKANMTLSWNTQIAGHEHGGQPGVSSGRLDLTNFERHQIRARIGVGF
jgi:hypothetical protein